MEGRGGRRRGSGSGNGLGNERCRGMVGGLWGRRCLGVGLGFDEVNDAMEGALASASSVCQTVYGVSPPALVKRERGSRPVSPSIRSGPVHLWTICGSSPAHNDEVREI